VHNPLDVLGEPEVDVGEPHDVHGEARVSITCLVRGKYRHVEIASGLRANLHAPGVVTIRTGGLLDGKIRGRHLVVKVGGASRVTTSRGDSE
jgi:cytoskeletal protein CcmA (bactofilin family)